MSQKTRIIQSKSVKISSKGQITLPKKLLEQMDLSSGQTVHIELHGSKLEITNEQKTRQKKLKNFKPISIGGSKKVNLSETHNDIYD
jgi:AbrB family looped-hinge helix DNA binding protein